MKMSGVENTNSESHASYSIVDHTADWALRIRAKDIEELFVTAAIAMSSLLVNDLDTLPLDVSKRIEITAIDNESLLVDWLSELAYWAEMDGIVFRQFIVDNISEKQLSALVVGGQAKELQKHIKAVTYHDLMIIKTDEGIEATVVFDV